jgi:hypothetical protein
MIRLRAGKLVSQPYPKVPLELLQLLLQVAGELASAIGSLGGAGPGLSGWNGRGGAASLRVRLPVAP